jgi:hypothetical protein
MEIKRPKTPGSGRKKGTPNKRTVLDREEAREAAKRIAAKAGLKVQDIDAHTLLKLFYQCEEFTPRFRKECAAEALKYEKPALSAMDSKTTETVNYVVEMPPPVKDLNEWMRMHMHDASKPNDDRAERIKKNHLRLADEEERKRCRALEGFSTKTPTRLAALKRWRVPSLRGGYRLRENRKK